MNIEGYERNEAEKKLLMKSHEAEEVVKNDEAWLSIDELKALMEDQVMKYLYFTDIEEVAKQSYDYSERFYDKNNHDTATLDTLGTTGTANNIRKMQSYPNDEILKEVNVEGIYIVESLSCINHVLIM